MAVKENNMTLQEKMKRHISHAAFLPLSKFDAGDSLRHIRPEFRFVGKIAMLIDATFDEKTGSAPIFHEEEMYQLDSVDDFVAFLKAKGISEVNQPPKER